MTFSYEGALQTDDKDWIRFTISDTNSSNVRLYDEEIQALIDIEGGKERAARVAMERILTILAEEVNYTSGKTKVEAGQAYDKYLSRYQLFMQDFDSHQTTIPVPAVTPPIFHIGLTDWR